MIVVARTFAFFVWQLVIALVVIAAASALWTLVIGSGFVHTFDVALYLVGAVLLIFGGGAMTFQITWNGPVDNRNAQRPQTRRRARFGRRLDFFRREQPWRA